MNTTVNPFVKPERFSEPLGFRKNGKPFFLMGGGDDTHEVVPAAPATPVSPDLRFTADDLEKARREEKDKLYQRLEQESAKRVEMEQQVQTLLKAQQDREAAEAEARAKADAEAKKAQEAELSAKELLEKREQELAERLASQQTDWEQKFAQIQQDRELERAQLEKEKQFASLAAYTQQRLAQEKDNIAEELVSFVSGNTPEEIDASIESVKAASARIAQSVQESINTRMPTQRGISPTGFTPVNPYAEESGTRTYRPEDIAAMSMKEYAEFRQKAGIGGNAQGLYN